MRFRLLSAAQLACLILPTTLAADEALKPGFVLLPEDGAPIVASTGGG